jgi:uncharacterized protein YdcH (DUF465 family)
LECGWPLVTAASEMNALNLPGQILLFHNSEPTRRSQLDKRSTSFVEHQTQDEDLKAHLLATNEQFRSLSEQHAQLKHRIEEIESKAHVTGLDEIEEQRLKKQKLHLKDQMIEILENYKHASVH